MANINYRLLGLDDLQTSDFGSMRGVSTGVALRSGHLWCLPFMGAAGYVLPIISLPLVASPVLHHDCPSYALFLSPNMQR